MKFKTTFFNGCFESGSLAELEYHGRSLLSKKSPTAPMDLQVDADFKSNPINFGKAGIQKKGGLKIPGQWLSDAGVTIGNVKFLRNDNHFHFRYTLGGFEIHLTYVFSDSAPTISIEPEIICRSAGAVAINQARLAFDAFRPSGPDDFFEIYDPKNGMRNLRKPFIDKDTQPNPFNKDNLVYESMDKCIAQEVSLAVHHAANINLFLWGHAFDGMALFYTYESVKRTLRYSQHWFPFAPMRRGQKIKLSPILLSIHEGEWSDFLKQVEIIKRDAQWTAPSNDQRLDGAIIYQAHGFVYDFGGFRGLIPWVKRLAQFGVTMLYLPPVFPPEAYLNSIDTDFLPALGTRADLRALTKACHALGIRVIVDFVVHNVYYRSPLIQKHPRWFRRDAGGNDCFEFLGGNVTETRDPGFQKFIIDYLDCLVRETDIDGFRFDVAGKQPPGFDTVAGKDMVPGTGVFSQTLLFQKLKKRLDHHKKCIYLEEGYGVLGLRYVTHGWIHFLKEGKKLIRRGDGAAMATWIRNLPAFFTDGILKNRADVMTMYHVRIHDTALIGLNLGRVLDIEDLPFLFLAWTAKGVPFLLHGLERGRERLLCELGRLRCLPAFAKGDMVFDLKLKNAPDTVLAFRRTFRKQSAYVFINFSTEPAAISFDAPEPAVAWYDFSTQDIPRENPAFSQCPSAILAPCSIAIFLNQRHSGIREKLSSKTDLKSEVKTPDALPFHQERLDLVLVEKDETQGKKDGEFSESSLGESNSHSVNVITEWKEDISRWNCLPIKEWLPVFLPTVRQPFTTPKSIAKARWIEALIPGEFMWNRHPAAVRPQVFRRDFNLKSLPKSAHLSIASPAGYDYPLILATEWAYAEAGESNECEAYINAEKVYAGNQDGFLKPCSATNFLRRGSNTLVVVVHPTKGSRGLYACLRLKTKSRTTDIISDGSWFSLPFDREDFASNPQEILERTRLVKKTRVSSDWKISVTKAAPAGKHWRWSANFTGANRWELWRNTMVIFDGTIPQGVDWRSPYSGEPYACFDSQTQGMQAGDQLYLYKGTRQVAAIHMEDARRVRLETGQGGRGGRLVMWFGKSAGSQCQGSGAMDVIPL